MATLLTPRQQSILDAITQHTRKRGFPPTYRDLMRLCGIGSPNGVLSHIKALRRKGFVQIEPKRSRAITVTGFSRWRPVLPYGGAIN